jgi:RNA polymerase sigma factor (sigma-70 family)
VTDANRAIEAVWRIESARLIAELAQDALVAALEQWPQSGVPDNPGAWLMATAKHRAIDRIRRSETLRRKTEELERAYDGVEEVDFAAAADDDIGDDLLSLIFVTCHPVLSREARVALTLRLLGGLSTLEISRAFLTPEATVAQRIVRAKRTLAAADVPFEVPPPVRSSTWSSTRATRRRRGTTGCARSCAWTRCASAGSWRRCARRSPRSMGSWR